MKMRSKIFFTALIGLITFWGCDYIDEPYVYQGPNGCNQPTPTFTPRTSPVKKVLVEDMTGHRCGNCPRAAETIAVLRTTYPGQVIAIGLHSALSGTFTEIMSSDTTVNPELEFTYDFRTSVATEIDGLTFLSTSGALPNGFVNRKDYGGGSAVIGHTQWSSKVAAELSLPQQMDIQLYHYWTPSDSNLCTYYFVEALMNLNANYKICLFLIENDIENWQKDYNETPSEIENYIHEHVLRGSLNGTWGTQVNSNSVIADNEQFIDGFSMKIDTGAWDINNLYVVAFVYNAATYEVIQAEELKVIP